MKEPSATTLDAQGMLCAQALALAANAMNKLAAGSSLRIVFNAPDVKNDLLAWARQKGYTVSGLDDTTICLMR